MSGSDSPLNFPIVLLVPVHMVYIQTVFVKTCKKRRRPFQTKMQIERRSSSEVLTSPVRLRSRR